GLDEHSGDLILRLESAAPFCVAEIFPRFQSANPLGLFDLATKGCEALNGRPDASTWQGRFARIFGGMFTGTQACAPLHLHILSQNRADLCRAPTAGELRGHCLRVRQVGEDELEALGLLAAIPKVTKPKKKDLADKKKPEGPTTKKNEPPQPKMDIGGRVQVKPSDEEQTLQLGRRLSVVLPAGSVKAPAILSAAAIGNPPPSTHPVYAPLASADIRLGSQKTFDKPIQLVYRYDPAKLAPGLSPELQLSAASWNPKLKRWEPEEVEVDPVRHEARIKTRHLSLYGWWIADEINYWTTPYPSESSGQKAKYRFIVNKKIPAADRKLRVNRAVDWLTKAENSYRKRKFLLPTSRLDVILELNTGGNSMYSAQAGNRYILLPWRNLNALEHDCAHELFHAVQNQYHWKIAMQNLLWWVETTAETAAFFIHGPKQVAEIRPDWMEESLMSHGGEHFYTNAHFLHHAIVHSKAKLKGLWDATTQSAKRLGVDLADGAWTRDLRRAITLKPIDAYFKTLPGHHSLHSLYQDFLIHLLFSTDSLLVTPISTRFAKTPWPVKTKALKDKHFAEKGDLSPKDKAKFHKMAEEEKKQIQTNLNAEALALKQAAKEQAILLTDKVSHLGPLALQVPSPVLNLAPDGSGALWSLMVEGPPNLERKVNLGLDAASWPAATGACLVYLPGNRKLAKPKPVQCLAKKQIWFKPVAVKAGDGLHVLVTHFGTQPIRLQLQARASLPPMKLEVLGLTGLGILLPDWFVAGKDKAKTLLSSQAWPVPWAGISVAPGKQWKAHLAQLSKTTGKLKSQGAPKELTVAGRKATLQVYSGRIKVPASTTGTVFRGKDWWVQEPGQEIEEELLVQKLKLPSVDDKPAIGLLAISRPAEAEAMAALLTSLRPVNVELVDLPIGDSGFAIRVPSHWASTRVPQGMDIAAPGGAPSLKIRGGKELGGIAKMESDFKEQSHRAGARFEKQVELSDHLRSGISARYLRFKGKAPDGSPAVFHALFLQRGDVHLSLTARGTALRKLLLSLHGPKPHKFLVSGVEYSLDGPAGFLPQQLPLGSPLLLKSAKDATLQVTPMGCATPAAMQQFLEAKWTKGLTTFKALGGEQVMIAGQPVLLKRYEYSAPLGAGRILVLYFVRDLVSFSAFAVGKQADESMLERSLKSLKPPKEKPFLLAGTWRGQAALQDDEGPSSIQLRIDGKTRKLILTETGAQREHGNLKFSGTLSLDKDGQFSMARKVPGGRALVRSKQICIQRGGDGKDTSEMVGELELRISGKFHK
ncbi:MAG: hypothetical protein JRF33_26595, partial [Deltaproteobacteria bacterium]|nr:hypothetical protein [Deltaproteobacteria bacterium]